MRKSFLVGLLVACVTLTIGVISCGQGSDEASSGENSSSGPQEHIVEIMQMKFVPAELTVHKGDKVTFINRDLLTHDITDDPGKSWTSSQLPADESWSMTFTQSSNYYCTLHPVMKGKIIVE